MTFRGSASVTSVRHTAAVDNVRVRVMRAVEKSCELIATEAKAICPRDTGTLADSIIVTPPVREGNTITGYVSATVPYAAFVEFGTGIRGMGTYAWKLPASGVPFTGEWVYDHKKKDWKGHEAQPFMRPALDTSRDQIFAIFAENLAGRPSLAEGW